MMFVNLEKRFRVQHAIECILLIFLVELCRCQQSSDICNLISTRNNASYGCTLQREEDAASIPNYSVELHLSFSDHQFDFTDGFLPSLPLLETLHLYVSQGSGKLPARFFSKLGHLKKLMLYKDDSAPESFELQLEDDTFLGLESLIDLHMPDLGISTLPVKVFNGLGKLKKLNLGKNRVSEVKYGTFRSNCCHEMRDLFLGMNDISDIGKISFNGLDSLLTIDLHGNKISRLGHLSFLNLSVLLTDVNLGANKIAFIDRFAFSGLDNLKKLYLDLNELTRVESSMFDGLPSLTVLDMSNNHLDDLTRGAFAKLQFLRDLSLRHNKISSIVADAFEGLRNLEKLELRGNQIHVLDETTFYGLRNLKVLELEHNKIHVIEKNTFIPVLHLQKLYLQHNKLRRLSPEGTKLSDLTSLTTFNVSHNSWHCTCDLKPLVDWMKERKFETPHREYVCASPGVERNTSISDFVTGNTCSKNGHFSATEGAVSSGQKMDQKNTASGKTTIYRQLLYFCLSVLYRTRC